MDAQLLALQRSLAARIDGVDPGDLVRRQGDKWSAVQILEHLLLTYAGTTKGMKRCLSEQRPLAGTPKLFHRAATLVVVHLRYMPAGRQAPERTIPQGMAASQVIAELSAELQAMDTAITECETRFGKRTRLLDHPVLGPLNAHHWRRFHWVHGQHHLKQIDRLLPIGRGSAAVAT